jgi:hypothetical protein
MAEWIINSPIPNTPLKYVTADKLSINEHSVTLYNEGGGIVCAITHIPGLIVTRKDAAKD